MKPRPEIRKIDPAQPDSNSILQAASLIKEGKVIGFPTTCLYGLGADALNPRAVDRLFEIKQRPTRKPILVLIHHKEHLASLAKDIPPAASKLIHKFWPGSLTIVFEAVGVLPANLTAGTGKIGVRCCRHPVARAIVNAVDGPVTGTSANLAGQPGCASVSAFYPELATRLDLILDAGKLKGGIGSTVVDVTQSVPKVLREGLVSANDIYAAIE